MGIRTSWTGNVEVVESGLCVSLLADWVVDVFLADIFVISKLKQSKSLYDKSVIWFRMSSMWGVELSQVNCRMFHYEIDGIISENLVENCCVVISWDLWIPGFLLIINLYKIIDWFWDEEVLVFVGYLQKKELQKLLLIQS